MRPTGQQVLDLARTRLGEPYLIGASVPKNDKNWHGPWDCAEFTAWVVFQVSGILYGCSTNDPKRAKAADAYTGFYARDSLKLGTGITVAEAAKFPGALVLRLAKGKKYGHIVFSDGHGGTIEAHSKNDGVVERVLAERDWNVGILIPGIEYVATKEV